MTRKTINIITLGCSKNLVDSEHLALQLQHNGFVVLHNSMNAADIVIVNTCGFIADAKEEAINTILCYAQQRCSGIIEHLFVMGCLSQRYADALRKEIPEVDDFFGVNSMEQVLNKLGAVHHDVLQTERLLATPPHYAYLKVSEGCSRQCSFCAIPFIRGKHVSKPIPELINEASRLAQQGVRELIIVAQDLSSYGADIYGSRHLCELLHELCNIDGIEWIRLHYLYPDKFVLNLLNVINKNPKICPYLDIPIQHISDDVLKNMRRGYNRENIKALISAIRINIPRIALRTTLMVGFPGESEDNFNELLEFIGSTRFERLGVFAYSSEDDTYSAAHLPDIIPQKEKQRRLHEIMTLQRQISLELNQKSIGSRLPVIIDEQKNGIWHARTSYDSPNIDGQVLIRSILPLKIGNIYDIKVTHAQEYDIYGEL
jgi:ribosomal protein S12 methylthiotransferase